MPKSSIVEIGSVDPGPEGLAFRTGAGTVLSSLLKSLFRGSS
jgi:hypothetical protein